MRNLLKVVVLAAVLVLLLLDQRGAATIIGLAWVVLVRVQLARARRRIAELEDALRGMGNPPAPHRVDGTYVMEPVARLEDGRVIARISDTDVPGARKPGTEQ